MNYNIDGPSYQSYSTSSSSSDEDNYEQVFASSRNALCATIARNNSVIAHYLIEQQKQETHGGSIPGHIVINRDRENVDHNLFNDYCMVFGQRVNWGKSNIFFGKHISARRCSVLCEISAYEGDSYRSYI